MHEDVFQRFRAALPFTRGTLPRLLQCHSKARLLYGILRTVNHDSVPEKVHDGVARSIKDSSPFTLAIASPQQIPTCRFLVLRRNNSYFDLFEHHRSTDKVVDFRAVMCYTPDRRRRIPVRRESDAHPSKRPTT